MDERKASVTRETRETKVTVEVNLDGTGKYQVNTGNGFFDHLLSQLSRHSLIDLTVQATGDAAQTGWHHTVEDVSIAVGRALNEAIGEGRGIVRMGHAIVPFDENHIAQREAHGHVDPVGNLDYLLPELRGMGEQFVPGSEILRHSWRCGDQREPGDPCPDHCCGPYGHGGLRDEG